MKEVLSVLAAEWRGLNEDQKSIYREESVRESGALSNIPVHGGGAQISGIPRRVFNSKGEPFKKPMTPYMCFLKEQTALLSQT
jgi:hypothetical protein